MGKKLSAEPSGQTSRSPIVTVVSDGANTTWRMFVPTIGLMLAGIKIDQHFGTTPWMMIIGLLLGSIIATLLVKRLLTDINHR